MQGSARQLAVKIFDLNWEVPSVRYLHLNCEQCRQADDARASYHGYLSNADEHLQDDGCGDY